MSLEARLTTVIQSIGADIKALQAASVGSDSIAPYFLDPGATFSVAVKKQVLFANNIDNEGFLAVDGLLVEV